MDNEDDAPEEGDVISRAPTEDDLVSICRLLNQANARYLVLGGFAIIYSGYGRSTGDLDFLIDTSRENEAKVYKALESLADKAVLQLKPGEVEQYTVVRVADEIVIDLMKSASGIEYEEAAGEVVIR